MQLGDHKNKLRDWSDCVAAAKREHERKTGEIPDAIHIEQIRYLEICSAAGSLIKQIHGLNICVKWGETHV